MRPLRQGRLLRPAVLAAVGAALGVAGGAAVATVPATAAPRPARHLLVTVHPEPGQALPSAGRVAAATAALEAQGLSVTRGPGLLLEASGPATAGTAARALGGVAAVADTVQEIHWRPHTGVIGNDLLQAYSVPSPPPLGVPVPTISSSTPIIASIQLAGWNDTDLTAYARTQGAANVALFTDPGYDPVASGQYAAVSVDNANPADESSGGQFEVALDQEALLAVAPQLRQRGYFAANGTAGIASAFNQVLADVTHGLPIVALTTSWGSCEDGSPAFTDLKNALEPTLQALNAAGVTVFAASGDAGEYDCAPDTGPGQLPDPRYTKVAVDYPCSSPSVECVGGTSHPNGQAPPAPDTAWENATTSDCGDGGQCGQYQGSGTGGGASTVFARPAWQTGGPPGSQRLVPDFALDGDPQTGLQVVVDGQAHQIGGTSLAAPAAAAMLADIVATAYPACAVAKGLGDIHAVLYAPDHPEDFVDVVAPTSTTAIQPAGPGFDESTGLGTPVWAALAPPLRSLLAPGICVGSWKAGPTTRTLVSGSWAVVDPSGSGINAIGVTVTSSVPTDRRFTTVLPASARSFTFTGKPGRTYTLAVAAAGSNGTLGIGVARATVTLPFDDRAAQVSRGWARKINKHAYASTVSTSATAGATAKLTVRGSTLGVVVDFGRTNGLFLLLVDGKPVKTVDTGGATRWAVPITVTRKAGKHTIAVRVLGTHRHGRGATVALDGVIAR